MPGPGTAQRRRLDVSATDPGRYAWEPVAPGDPDHMEHARRILHVVADRTRWQARSRKPYEKPRDCFKIKIGVSGAVLLGEYSATWIAERPGLRPKTITLYGYLCRAHIAPYSRP